MANRMFVRNYQTLEKGPVELFGEFTVGTTGAPTINTLHSKGIASITRTGVGAYTVALSDTYQRLMALNYVSVSSSPASINAYCPADNSATQGSPNFHIQFVSAAGSAVELANGELIRLEVVFSNSTAI